MISGGLPDAVTRTPRFPPSAVRAIASRTSRASSGGNDWSAGPDIIPQYNGPPRARLIQFVCQLVTGEGARIDSVETVPDRWTWASKAADIRQSPLPEVLRRRRTAAS